MCSAVLEEIVFRLSLRAHGLRKEGGPSQNPASFSVDAYRDWRADSLKEQFEEHFSWDAIRDKRVLDFGCGFGSLANLCIQRGAASVIGTDRNAGLRIWRKGIPFSGSLLRWLKEWLVRLPWPDFFCACAIYELEKPNASRS